MTDPSERDSLLPGLSSVNNGPHCAHDHIFVADNGSAERSTWIVAWITAVMMVVEIAGGYVFNSMALLADGWHMSSHTVAIGLSAFAYAMARRYARDPRFAFGTWKIEILGGYTSALFLIAVAVSMVWGSVERLLAPETIAYREAVLVAVIGLVINVVCALILGRSHDHDQGAGGHAHHDHSHQSHSQQGHDHGGEHRHHDLNLRAAYIHVIADAATSVLAIVALFGGWLYGWRWLDPVMGIVGAILVAVWARGLLADTGKILLDREMDHPVVDEVRAAIAEHAREQPIRISDLHVWRVGRQAYSVALSIVTGDRNLTPAQVREWLSVHEEIAHVTVEIQRL